MISPLNRSELANAAYMLGRTALAEQLAADAIKVPHDHTVAYRVELLLARCAFMNGDLGRGQECISRSVAAITNAPGVPAVEVSIKSARASLTCAEMHLALGRPQQATACMEVVHHILKDLPATGAIVDLRRQLDSLIVISHETEKSPLSRDFSEYVADLESDWDKSERRLEGKSPALAASDEKEESATEDQEENSILQTQAIEDRDISR